MTLVNVLCGWSGLRTVLVSETSRSHRCYANNSTGDAASSGSATFSGRREGFALYFARLVRPFWKAKLTRPGYVPLLGFLYNLTLNFIL
jgi:hypothetical protein